MSETNLPAESLELLNGRVDRFETHLKECIAKFEDSGLESRQSIADTITTVLLSYQMMVQGKFKGEA